MKAIKIDVEKQTVTDIDLTDGLEPMYQEIKCEYVEAFGIIQGETLWIDEEGQLKSDEQLIGGFIIGGINHVFFGNALITGTSMAGKTISTNFKASAVVENITFLTAYQLKELRK